MFERVDFNKRNNVRLPSFNRLRLALRSPLKSQPTNLEDQQLSYDIYNLQHKMAEITDQFLEDNLVLEAIMAELLEMINQVNIKLEGVEEN